MIIATAAMIPNQAKTLSIGDRTFDSRLLVGTGKFSSPEFMKTALRASGSGLVTVALKRADPFATILDFLEPDLYLILPNTTGAMNADEAIRIARLAAAGLQEGDSLEIVKIVAGG